MFEMSFPGIDDNTVDVFTIAERDALNPDPNKIVRVVDASADPNVDAGTAWYQYDEQAEAYTMVAEAESANIEAASETKAGIVRMATNAEAVLGSSAVAMTPAQVIARIQDLGIEYVGGSSYAPSNPDELEDDYPAASNSGKWSMIFGTDARDGIYRSNGTMWVKLMDDSGDRTKLWNFGAGNVFLSTNELHSTAGTSGSSYFASSDGYQANANANFDGNTSVGFGGTGRTLPYGTARIWSFGQKKALGKFHFYSRGGYTGSYKIVGYHTYPNFDILNPSFYDELTPIEVTESNDNATIVGNQIDHDTGFLVYFDHEIVTDNTKEYLGYGVIVLTGSTTTSIFDLIGYEVVDNSTTIDLVSSVNKLNEKLKAVGGTDLVVSDAQALDDLTPNTGQRVTVEDGGSGEPIVYTWNGSSWEVENVSSFQEIEARLNSIEGADQTVSTIAARDALVGVAEGEVVTVRDDGTGQSVTYQWDGSQWVEHTISSRVQAVEGGGETVATIAARDGLTGVEEGERVSVSDSGDGTTRVYEWNGSSWVDVTSENPATQALQLSQVAQADAATADGKAVDAQTDATQALTNAATADGKAVAAQTDATQALADAATADGKAVAAQTDATQALADAATADSKAVAAQADATQALADAAAASGASGGGKVYYVANSATGDGSGINTANYMAAGEFYKELKESTRGIYSTSDFPRTGFVATVHVTGNTLTLPKNMSSARITFVTESPLTITLYDDSDVVSALGYFTNCDLSFTVRSVLPNDAVVFPTVYFYGSKAFFYFTTPNFTSVYLVGSEFHHYGSNFSTMSGTKIDLTGSTITGSNIDLDSASNAIILRRGSRCFFEGLIQCTQSGNVSVQDGSVLGADNIDVTPSLSTGGSANIW